MGLGQQVMGLVQDQGPHLSSNDCGFTLGEWDGSVMPNSLLHLVVFLNSKAQHNVLSYVDRTLAVRTEN